MFLTKRIAKKRVKIFIFTIFILVVTIGAFFPVFKNGFHYFWGDDGWNLYNNPYTTSLDIENISAYFTDFYEGQYSPLNTLFYGIMYFFIEYDPFYYHLFCLLIHVTNVFLVFIFIENLLNLKEPDSFAFKNSWIAFFTAFFFAIHPMQVESVAWIAASKILLYSFFYLISLIFYLKYLSSTKFKYYLLTVLFFILSFGAKEQCVVLPVTLILLDIFLSRKFVLANQIAEKAPFFVIAIFFGIISIYAQLSVFAGELETNYYPLWQRIFFACYSLTQYVITLLLPTKLSYWYSFPMKSGEPLPIDLYFYPIFVLFLLLYFYSSLKKGKKHVVFGIGFFIINILLVLHLIPMSRNIMADRYVYLSCIGLFVIFSNAIFNVIFKMKSSIFKISAMILIAFYLGYLICYTYKYTIEWGLH